MSELQSQVIGALLLAIVFLNLVQMRFLYRIRRRLRRRLP
jgi:hypothetical protein